MSGIKNATYSLMSEREFGGLQTVKAFVFLMPRMQSSGNATSIRNLQVKLKLLKDTGKPEVFVSLQNRKNLNH